MDNKLNFYSSNDLQQINDNLDQIEIEAEKKGFKLLDPTNEEYDKVRTIILDFIKEEQRIIYGGSAYHRICEQYKKDKNDTDKIYKDWTRYDVEFYSPNPIRDLTMICNRINDANIKYVIGRQAQHDETFTVFANFLQYCDMSYMPKKIFDKIEYLTIDGIRYIHPDMILIDIFRMYNDPLTSYWRLSKVFKRMRLLLDRFPYDFKECKKVSLEPIKDNQQIINYILPILVDKFEKILFTGELAYLVYTNPENEINSSGNLSQIEIITDDIDTVGKFIKSLTYKWADSVKKLESYEKLFKIKFYSRFFQYWDKRVIIFYNDKPIFTIVGSNGRCVPFIKSKMSFENSKNSLDIKIGSFLVTFNYYFIGSVYERIMNQGFYYGGRDFINSLLTVRNEFLKSKNKTVIDSTIYKEFIIECSGKTVEFSREFMLKLNEKRARGERGILTYDPTINRGTYIEYVFEQSDGLELN